MLLLGILMLLLAGAPAGGSEPEREVVVPIRLDPDINGRHSYWQGPEDSRDQPRDSVNQHHGRQFSAGENIVADRNLVGHDFFQYPLVNPLVVTAQKDQILLHGELLRNFLRKG